MKVNRQTQIIIIITLVIALTALTIGFAAFSRTLAIKSTLTIKPDPSTFKVVFSVEEGQVKEGEVTAKHAPGIQAQNAIIINSARPTITNLNVKFTDPGQIAIYKFYVYNAGEYVAHLNSIKFLAPKKCIADNDIDNPLVQAACEGIKINLDLGSINTYGTVENIVGEKLEPKESKEVTVTLEYLGGSARADGPFNVTFGDISLYYATVTGQNEPETSKVCSLSNDANNNDMVDTGDMVTCSTDEISENFYVMPNHEEATTNTVSMLTEKNISADINNPQQISSYQEIKFASNMYWGSNIKSGTFIYNSNSDLYKYVEAYTTNLKSMGLYNIKGTLPSYQQLINIGCSVEIEGNYTTASKGNCINSPLWIRGSYWTGSSDGNSVWHVYHEHLRGHGSFPYDSTMIGLRPVIIIPLSEIE